MIKVGDTVRRKKDGLEAKVLGVFPDGTLSVECEDWQDIVLESQWEEIRGQKSK